MVSIPCGVGLRRVGLGGYWLLNHTGCSRPSKWIMGWEVYDLSEWVLEFYKNYNVRYLLRNAYYSKSRFNGLITGT